MFKPLQFAILLIIISITIKELDETLYKNQLQVSTFEYYQHLNFCIEVNISKSLFLLADVISLIKHRISLC